MRLGRGEDVASSAPFRALCSRRGALKAARPLSAWRNWGVAASQRLVPLSGVRFRPLPLAAHPFPFLPLLLRFHPHRTPSLRDLAAVAPFCSSLSSSFLHLLPGGGSGGGSSRDLDSCCLVPPARGALGKALAGDLCGRRGWKPLDEPHFVESEAVCFAFRLSVLKGHRCREGLG